MIVKKDKVLLISHQFPPDNGSLQRVLNHLKFLPKFNYEPIVLTHIEIGNIEIDSGYERIGIKVIRTGFKKSLFQRIYSNTNQNHNINNKSLVDSTSNVKRRLYSWLKNFIFWPDIFIDWIPFAFAKAIGIILNQNVKLVYIISPPHSSNLLVLLLKLFTKSKIIIDFRDPWSDDVDIKHPTLLHKKSINLLEKLVCFFADEVITTTEHHTAILNARYFSKSNKKAITITNGFNSDEFNSNSILNKDFNIVYTGNFDSTRNPLSFLNAVANISKMYPGIFKEHSIRLYGNYNPIVQNQIQSLNLDLIVKQYGIVQYLNAILIMKSASLLLLVVHNDEKTSKFSIPAKLFEYMASRRPILAITPYGETQEIIDSLNVGKCFTHENIKGIEEYLLECSKKHSNGTLYLPENTNISKYDRINLTKKLTDIFDNAKK